MGSVADPGGVEGSMTDQFDQMSLDQLSAYIQTRLHRVEKTQDEANELRFAVGHALVKASASFRNQAGNLNLRAWGRWRDQQGFVRLDGRPYRPGTLTRLMEAAEAEPRIRVLIASQLANGDTSDFFDAVDEARRQLGQPEPPHDPQADRKQEDDEVADQDDGGLLDLRAQLADRDKTIADRDKTIATLQEQLVAKEARLKHLTRSNERLRADLRAMKAQTSVVQQSS
jgi:hypothetical protein